VARRTRSSHAALAKVARLADALRRARICCHCRCHVGGGGDECAIFIFVLVYIDGGVVARPNGVWCWTPDGAVDLRPTAGVFIF